MDPIRFSDVLRATGGEPAGPVDGDPVVPAVTTDSRQVPKGSLFIPIRGKKHDAHQFVEGAFLAGAGFSLAARDAEFARMPANVILVKDTTRALGDLARWYRSRFEVPVVGITGSCGKTTVKEMLRLVLGEDVVASPASYNNEFGVPLTLLQMTDRTRACVVEIGTNGPGEIEHLTGIARPTVGIVTNVEEAHLEGLGSVQGVMEEKAHLLSGLPPDGAAVVNADNYYCREMMEEVACHLVTYGTWEDSDVYGMEPQATPQGVAFYLYGKIPFEIPALGIHNVVNALAAVATGLWLGRDPMAIREALSRYQAPPMRMSREVVGEVTLINDAYNANPRSMDAAIGELAARECGGRRVAVLGEMLELGPDSERYHRALGRKVANSGIDRLWAVGPSAHLVADEAVGYGMTPSNVRHHPTVEAALAEAPFEPRAGDTWLFKASRGMRLERLAEGVRRALARLGGAPEGMAVSRLGGTPPVR
jgi:UDP-N-acetylmuramoyl-tripeptide--D-alanyl-D-alanine ligase